jgi:hypothetical protein
MEEKNLSICYNCSTEIDPSDKFCHACGQKNTAGKIAVWTLIKEFFVEHLHLDSKLPRTVFYLLFKPGGLTIQYFEGKHLSFIRPLRLFAISAILFFAVAVYTLSSQLEKLDFYSQGHDRTIEKLVEDSIFHNIEDSLISVKKQLNLANVSEVLDSTFAPFRVTSNINEDTLSIGVINLGYMRTRPMKILKKDIFTLTDKEIVAKYPHENLLEKLVLKQNLKILKNSSDFVRQTAGYISWMFFLMIPVFSLLLKLVYVRRKMYYVEHLIFTFHIHAFFFLIFTLNALSDALGIVPLAIAMDIIAVFGTMIYIFVAMRRYYRQKIWKTLLKSLMLFAGYVILVMFFTTITVLISLALF